MVSTHAVARVEPSGLQATGPTPKKHPQGEMSTRTSRPFDSSASRIRQVGGRSDSPSMTAIWAPSGRKARFPRPGTLHRSLGRPRVRSYTRSSRRSLTKASRRLSGLNRASLEWTGPGSFRTTAPWRSTSQTVRAATGFPRMRGHQVSAVGAELEGPDVAIAPGLESGDLSVVGGAANLDRPVSEPECIAGHGGVEGGQDHARWSADDPADRLEVGQAANRGDRQVAEFLAPRDDVRPRREAVEQLLWPDRSPRGCRIAGRADR